MPANYKNQDGFIALTSVILISAALLILAGVLSTSGFYSRFNVLDYENKKVSTSLAEACAESALAGLAANPSGYGATIPPAGIQIAVDAGKTCKICFVSGASPYTIIERGSYQNAYANLTVNVTLGAANFTVNSWDEQAIYSGSCTLP